MKSLQARLLFSYLIVLAVLGIVLFGVMFSFAPAAYNRHMINNNAMMTPMPGMNQPGLGPRGQGQAPFLNFRAGMLEALGYAMLAASLVALLVSLYISDRIVAPLRQMSRASQRIAQGHYSERVTIGSEDELGQMGEQFNGMAAQLEQVESMRRRLIGDVSHELRTPLTAIKGYMEGLVDGVLPAAPETYQQVHAEAERLSRLVDDLQELSRVEARAYELNLQPLALAPLAQTVIRRLQPQLDQKDIHPSLDFPSDLPLVRADADRIIQVLTNLVGNALCYTPAGGQVRVSAVAAQGQVRVSVADTGLGIPAESLPHIFDRFYRVDKSRSRQAGGGSGIGLTVAKHLVEAHGGRIWAESPGEGQGSVFYFTLQSA